ncbi:succinate dehydrogenase, hydrophobic membrane anchor protein [Falsirhodobacter sp. alg1]|uniref:succinate dehydrogenase, hydrophobic membrane anchor protein n=1 Tax=Falsirhodobacter sp. alg1 TaxID=1472418 RepID=UPI0005F0A3F4|nr:succinate dehydrogenase, hydrophobic membrane anchor protein [Falsirhodobacter sp. alg1]
MRYLTDYKRVAGLGSAHSGAHHHWQMQVSSAALLILIPLFIFTFGAALGSDYESAVIYYSRPFPAVVAGLTLVVGLLHFKNGAQVMLEDYSKGHVRQGLILLVTAFSYVCMGLGIFALVKLAL